jgi:hypothetical protein
MANEVPLPNDQTFEVLEARLPQRELTEVFLLDHELPLLAD